MTAVQSRLLGIRACALAAGAMLLAGLLAIYWQITFGGLVLSGYDAQVYFFPYWSLASASFGAGRLPLWNPHVFMGVPFLANPQAAVLYPPNWALLPFEPARALSIALVGHVALAGVNMLALVRSGLGLTWAAAATAAAAFAFGGFFAGQAGHINQVSAAAWIPLLVLAVDRGVLGSRRWWFVAPVVVALVILAGHPQTAFVGLVFALLWSLVVSYCCHEVITPRKRVFVSLRPLLMVVASLMGGAALAAGQIFPALALSREGVRAGGLTFDEATSFSLPTEEILSGLLPTYMHLPSSTEFTAYVGIVGITLAILGVVKHWRQVRIRLLLIIAISAIILALGPSTPAFGWAHASIPGMDLFRVPARWLLLFVLSVSLLAAYGVDAISAGENSRRHQLRLAVAWIAGVVLLAVMALGLALTQPELPDGVAWTWAMVAVIAVCFVAGSVTRPRPVFAWTAAVLVVVELVVASGPSDVRSAIPVDAYDIRGRVLPQLVNPQRAGRVLSIANPSFEINDADRAVLAEAWRDRLGARSWEEFKTAWKNRDILSPNLPMAYRLKTPDGYDGGVLPLSSHTALREALIPGSSQQPDGLLMNQFDGLPSGRVLDALSVSTIVDDRSDAFETDLAVFDLRTQMLVKRLVEMKGLEVPDVVGVALMAAVESTGEEVSARVVVTDGLGVRHELSLFRADGSSAIAVLEQNRGISARQVLVSTMVISAGRFDGVLDVRAVAINPEGTSVDVRGLSLLLQDGSSVGLPLRIGEGMTVEFARDVTITRRTRDISRVWLPPSVRMAPTTVDAQRELASSGLRLSEAAWLVVAEREPTDAGTIQVAFEDLGILRREEPVGLVSSGYQNQLMRDFGAADGWLRFNGVATATIIADRPESVTVEVTTDGPRILVLNDTMYAGWRALVDGVPTAVWQANLAQRAVFIPDSGQHTVTFEFSSHPLRVGLVVAAVAAGLLLTSAGLLVWRGSR